MLSSLVLDVLPSLVEFFVLTPAPSEACDLNTSIKKPGEPIALEVGYATRIDDDAHLLARWLSAELVSSRAIAVIENPLASPGFKFLEALPHRIVCGESTVLHVITGLASEAEIASTLGRSNLAFGQSVGIVTSPSRLPATGCVPPGDLKALVEAATWVVTEAHDGETFLLARREG